MLLTFLENNWWLVLVLVVSGAMLIWPVIQFRLGPVREVGAIQATQLINRQNALMLDVRETQEYEGGRVPNAVHLPLSQLAGRGAELKKFTSRPVIAYCDRGQPQPERGGEARQARFRGGLYAARRSARLERGRAPGREAGLMAPITMYSTEVCPFCVRAERLLRAKGVAEIAKVRVDLEPALRIEMVRKTGRRTVPQIYIGEVHVGGYDDLVALDRAGQLEPLLSAA